MYSYLKQFTNYINIFNIKSNYNFYNNSTPLFLISNNICVDNLSHCKI